MGHPGDTALKLSLVDISKLAKVQRPVVSMWRTRHRTSTPRFPEPVEVSNNQELFLGHEIVEWLQDTGRGNNPAAAEDMAAYASSARENFDLVTALLVVRTLSGEVLSGMHPEDVLDLAEELDPDDDFIFSELEAAVSSLEPLLSYIDQLVDAAFTAPAAFEKLLKDRSRFQRTDALFDPQVLNLVALTACSLSDGNDAFAEATPGGSDLLLAIADHFDEATSVTLAVTPLAPGSSRLAQRRLQVHAFNRENLRIGAPDLSMPGQITVVHFPATSRAKMSDTQIMTAIDNIALELDGPQAAVVLGPARLLTDKLAAGAPSQIRDTLMRSGKLRAIVRLPTGLLKSHPRQHLALWVLGKEQTNITIADRWTTVADLSAHVLDESGTQDLVADLLASLQNLDDVKARAFRFARLLKTRLLLSGDGNLHQVRPKPAGAKSSNSGSAEILVKAEAAIETLNESEQVDHLDIQLELGSSTALPTAPIGDLLNAKTLNLLPGTRFLVHDTTASEGFVVVGVPELLGGERTRRIDRLQLASLYPQAHLTEPGDVIFSTIGEPCAWVDPRGLNVVEFPARILRINREGPSGLIASVLAADITAGHRGSWRRWHVKRFHEDHLENTKTALEQIERSRQRALDRAAQLEQLSTLLAKGSATAALQIIRSTSTMEGNN
jgi:hypothetical protein